MTFTRYSSILLGAPHVLIAVRKLFRRAGMNFDRLGQVEQDAVAIAAENGTHHGEDERMQHQSLRHA